MKKICLVLVGLYLMLFHAFAQRSSGDTADYTPRPLQVDEVNLFSSYYGQNGNHSAITGGTGSEKVTDFSNGLEVVLVGVDSKQRKNTLTTGLNFDYHTAASQAWVSKTGASKAWGVRVYPSLNWLIENARKGTGLGMGLYYSNEYNYKSLGADLSISKKTNNNGEFTAKAQIYLDAVKMIYPSELVPGNTTTVNNTGTITVTTASGNTVVLNSSGQTISGHRAHLPSKPRDTYDVSLSFSQVINSRMQGSVMVDLAGQTGYLGLPFHRVYFTDGTDTVENLPSTRFKLPIGARLNYFLGDKIILRGYYRYYTDSWGITSQTASLEIPYKITPFFSVAPFYRYYTQSQSSYFAPYGVHQKTDPYYTSNYALSGFSSGYFGVNFRISSPDLIFNSLEIRYGHYTQTTDLVSDVISVSVKFKQ